MTNAIRSLAALAAFGLAAPALAQSTPTPTPAPAPRASTPPTITRTPFPSARSFNPILPANRLFPNSRFYVENYQQVQSFGRCVSNIGPKRARDLLDASPNTATERFEVRQISRMARACLPYGYAAPVIFLRGGIAEAMYRKQPTSAALHLSGSSNRTLAAFQAAEEARSDARLIDDRLFTRLANCLAVQAPVPVRAMLFSTHGSATELAAFNAMIAAAPACSAASRFPLSGARTFLRAYIAESAYRWSVYGADTAA